jgi:hypothetical protein
MFIQNIIALFFILRLKVNKLTGHTSMCGGINMYLALSGGMHLHLMLKLHVPPTLVLVWFGHFCVSGDKHV